MKVSTRIFSLFGLNMTNFESNPRSSNKIFRWISISCVVLLVSQSYIFILVHFGEPGMFLMSTYNLSCIGFGFVLALKIYMIGVKHHKCLLEVIGRLDAIFPKSNREQRRRQMKQYLVTSNYQNGSYSVLMLMLFAYFNFSDILTSIFKFLFIDGSYERNFTLFMWFPFGHDGKSPIVFEIFYVVSVWSGFTCLTINLAFDLLFCSLLSILCMKFENLKIELEEFGRNKSKADLVRLIRKHDELIE